MNKTHFEKLKTMYLSAPTNEYYKPEIHIEKGKCEITIPVKKDFYHAGSAIHGSVYFKMLDDSAYFASNSLETKFMLLTVSFSIQFIRPVNCGIIRAEGSILQYGKRIIFADSVLFDYKERICAKGNGTFTRSEIPLSEQYGYK